MRKFIMTLTLLSAVVIAACSPAVQPTPTPTETGTPTITLTSTPEATNTEAPTQTPFIIVVTATLETPAPTRVNCTPRTDWTTQYIVVAGDTLGKLAGRVGSTVNELAQGNCLSDPNRIVAGQRLRVPRTPATNTPTSTTAATITITATTGTGVTATSTVTATIEGATATTQTTSEATPTEAAPTEVVATTEPSATPDVSALNCLNEGWVGSGTDFVNISPNSGTAKPGCIQIISGTNATVSWTNAPSGATEVTFWRHFDETMRGDVIGVDTTPEDGFAVQFTFASIRNGTITAMATGGGSGNSDPIGYALLQ